jgi:hypothetical protein
MDPSDTQPAQPDPPSARRGKAVIKRRWAIMRSAGGGVAVIAVASAIALSDPTDQADYTSDPPGGDSQISLES